MQKELKFPAPKIVSTPKILLRAEITYYQTYYKDDEEYGSGVGFGFTTAHKRYKTDQVICGIVSNEEDGREVISRIDPAKRFNDDRWQFDHVDYYFQPVMSYEVKNA